jgi:hypothetical protein
MSNTEILIALGLVIGLPCATIIGICWMFVRNFKEPK